MFSTVVGLGVKYLLSPGCQDQPQLSIDPNVLPAINKAASLWGKDHPDVIQAYFAYHGGGGGYDEGEGYTARIGQTHNCCNKCDHYARRAQDRLNEIEGLIKPLLDSPQAGILGVKAGVVSAFTKPIYLIPICILIFALLFLALRR